MSSIAIEKSSLLSTFLPYIAAEKKTRTQITSALREYEMLVSASEKCITALKNGDFEAFDALVGENMCQVRAIKIALIAEKVFASLTEKEKSFSLVQKKIEALIKKGSFDNFESFHDLLEKEHLELILSEDEVYLVESFLLTKVKVKDESKGPSPLLQSEKTYPKNLQEMGAVSTNFANALVKSLRVDLATRSVHFVKECAKDNSCYSIDLEELTTEHNDLQSLPFFLTNEILLQTAMKEKLAVSLQVTSLSDSVATSSFTIFFAPIHNRYTLVDKIDKSKPALTFHAFMQRDPLHLPAKEAAIEEIAKHGFEKIFLCNSADHRQVLDPSQEELILSKLGARCKEYKEMAEAIGCSLSNPSLLFINHAFLSCIK